MTTTYARQIQQPTGRMQARDLETGDVVLIRKPGATERTAERILHVEHFGTDVVMKFEWGYHRTSSRMTAALA